MNNRLCLTLFTCAAFAAFAAFAADVPKGPKKQSDAAPHTFGREAALADLKKMNVADGLEVTLFAVEPQLVNPADMDVDARGRVWITEGANYRKWASPPLRPEGDRIVILEDTDGDGVADKVSTFYQGPEINTALGICVLGNKVIVSCSPNIMVFSIDPSGDKAAGPPQILFTGIKGTQHDHGAHAFVFGPDGKLYWNFGNSGGEVKTADGAKILTDQAGNRVTADGKPYRQGMVFRCNHDGSEFETLAWNFRNNYEVAVDSFGTLWQSDNDDDGNQGVRINYVMEFGNYGYADELTGAGWKTGWDKAKAKGASESDKVFHEWHQFDPGVVPNLLHTGQGSPTGIAVYEGGLLPKIFQGQVIHCDAGPRVVRAYPVTPSGAGYASTITNVLSSNENWFRPSDVCVAPDGSLFIADWNDAGVGGHNMADRDLATMTGRVLRVAPKGHKYSPPKHDFGTAAGCVAALQSPNQATRYLAWTELNKMQEKALGQLDKLFTEGKDARLRARAVQLLARIKGQEKLYVRRALQDKDENLRLTGLRIARALKQDVIPLVKQLADDKSAAVRRECAIALRHNPSPDAPKLWAQLAQQHDGKDRWYLEALGIAADKQEEKFFASWLGAVGERWNTPGARDIIWRSRTPKAAELLGKLATDKSATAADRDRYLRALDFVPKCKEKDDALAAIALGAL